MVFIIIRKKPADIILAVLCGVVMVITLFLLFLAVAFSLGDGSPNIFGSSVYLVKTDAFELVKNPSVVTAEKIEPDLLREMDIVIFALSDGKRAIGEIAEIIPAENINDTDSDSDNNDSGEDVGESDGEISVMYFTVLDELGEAHTVAEDSIIAKAMKTSAFFGVIVSFAVSPIGVFVIAVAPCVCVLGFEAAKPLLRKRREKEEITPVKKQDEIPTFIPEKSSAAALKAYKKTTGGDEGADGTPQLFPRGKAASAKPAPNYAASLTPNRAIPRTGKAGVQNKNATPLSSEKLAEAIAAVNKERSQSTVSLDAIINKTADRRVETATPVKTAAPATAVKVPAKTAAEKYGGTNGASTKARPVAEKYVGTQGTHTRAQSVAEKYSGTGTPDKAQPVAEKYGGTQGATTKARPVAEKYGGTEPVQREKEDGGKSGVSGGANNRAVKNTAAKSTPAKSTTAKSTATKSTAAKNANRNIEDILSAYSKKGS